MKDKSDAIPSLQYVELFKLVASPYQGRLIPEHGEGNHKTMKMLVESISRDGLMQPITVRPMGDKYEIIDGHRRVEAFRKLGNEKIPVMIKECSDKEAQVLSIIGNLQREELSNIERALAFVKILKTNIFKDKREFSKAIGRDETYVGDLLKTVNLDHRIISDLVKNKTTNDVKTHRAIRRVEPVNEHQKSEKQWKLYTEFREKGLSRAEVISLSKSEKDKPLSKFTVNLCAENIHIKFNEKLPRQQREMIRRKVEMEIERLMKEVINLYE